MSDESSGRHPLLVWAWSLLRLKFVGVVFGALFFCLSLTPPWYLETGCSRASLAG